MIVGCRAICHDARMTDTENSMSLLEQRRREKGFTQAELAAQLGVTQGTISRLQNGARPSLKLSVRIQRVLGVDPSEWVK